MIKDIAFLIGTSLMYGTPLLYTALGGVMSENSGVINIGLEGIMALGAFVGAWIAFATGNAIFAMFCAGIAGGALALILAVASITFNGNQTIVGTAINFIGPGIAVFASKLLFNGAAQTTALKLEQKMPKFFANVFPENSFFDIIFKQDFSVYFVLVLVLLIWFVLYKTKFGLRIRACGEHPKAAATLGIKVRLVRYVCVILSGVLAAFGGAAMSTAVASNFYTALISGHGFIALAAMIFGRWKPQGALGACLLFGFSKAVVILVGSKQLAISPSILSMLPYLVTLVVLMFTAKHSAAPAADGLPYET